MGVPGSEATKAKQFACDGEECIIGTENYTFTWFLWQSISLNSSFDPYSNIRREVGRENSYEKTGPHAHRSVLLTPSALPTYLITPVALGFSYLVSTYSLWIPSGQAVKHQNHVCQSPVCSADPRLRMSDVPSLWQMPGRSGWREESSFFSAHRFRGFNPSCWRSWGRLEKLTPW